MVAEIAAITAEQLVAAHTGEDHGDVAVRELGHEVGGDERAVGERLVHVPQELRQQRDDVRPHEDLVVIGAEPLGDPARERQLVVEALGGDRPRTRSNTS